MSLETISLMGVGGFVDGLRVVVVVVVVVVGRLVGKVGGAKGFRGWKPENDGKEMADERDSVNRISRN